MKKRFMSAFLAVIMLFSMLSTTAFAASSEEEALGEINIFNGGVTMSYLSINGRIREQIYTYYNRVTPSGAVKEIPAYCVNPNDKGVPQTVGVGESIKYLADEKAADPKVTGIIANGYPNRGLSELGLENASDVQCTPETMEEYRQMESEIGDIRFVVDNALN